MRWEASKRILTVREITGNLWSYYGKPGYAVCITTNGFLKKNGEAVMGRGCAYEATQRIPGIALKLGEWISTQGNVPGRLQASPPLIVFPVKHAWYEKADLHLIIESVAWLEKAASLTSGYKFILPRPGCGNGQLAWADVKPLLVCLPDNVLVIDFGNRR